MWDYVSATRSKNVKLLDNLPLSARYQLERGLALGHSISALKVFLRTYFVGNTEIAQSIRFFLQFFKQLKILFESWRKIWGNIKILTQKC